MSLEELAVYLRLTPEFGGTRFGPFEGLEIRLGSDPDRCHIVIPETLGVIGEHLRVIRQGPSNLIVTPAERAATVYLWKQGSRRPTQIQTPTAVRPGDAVALVTPDGPRFVIELDELPEEIKQEREEAAKRRGTGRSRLSADSMKTELKRQAWTTILTKGPMQLLQRAMTFVKSGAIYQPRNIILGVTILGGYIFGGAMLCSGRSTSKALATSEEKFSSCDERLRYCEGNSGDVEEQTFDQLVGSITREVSIGNALERDDALREEVKKRVKLYLGNPQEFDWIIKNTRQRARRVISWREAVMGSEKLDNPTRKLSVWLAANPKLGRDEFDLALDSAEEEVCVRGPLGLTWRQARNIGYDVQPDAFHRGTADAIKEDKVRADMLTKTLQQGNQTAEDLPEEFETDIQSLGQGVGQHCLYITGSDDRARTGSLLRQFERFMGVDAQGVPASDDRYGQVSRIARFHAADIKRVSHDSERDALVGLDFPDQTQPSVVLEDQASAGSWALKRTADTIALSVVIPCLLRLEGGEDQIKKVLGEDYAAPSAINCLVMNWNLTKRDN
jgi:hypothetical protein